MALSRRDFLHIAAGLAGGTALLGIATIPSFHPSESSSNRKSKACTQESLDDRVPAFIWNHEYSFEWTKEAPYSWIRGQHVSPVEKYFQLYERLASAGVITTQNTSSSCALTEEDFRLVHSKPYLDRLEQLAHANFGIGSMNSENPLNVAILNFVKASCSGTYHAARAALKTGKAMNLSGGFHHAFPDHEEGFCYLNDVAIAIKKLQHEGKIRTAMIIDGDVHHGNGNAF
jgi:acetoin utilization deacetylase AcuC-like enzyme